MSVCVSASKLNATLLNTERTFKMKDLDVEHLKSGFLTCEYDRERMPEGFSDF